MPIPTSFVPRRSRPALALALTLLAACGGGPTSPGPAVRLVGGPELDADVRALAATRADAVDGAPLDAELRVQLALAYEANGLWVEAERAWDQALHFDAERPVWLSHKAHALAERGDIDAAVATFERVVQLDPAQDAARFRLGMLYLERAEDERALAAFAEVARRQPNAPSAFVGQAEALNNLERESEAVAAAEQAVKLEPSYKRAHYALGIAYRGLGRLEEAERELALGADSEARYLGDSLSVQMQASRRGFGARVQDAIDLVDANRPAAAVPILEEVLVGHPDDRIALVNLGVAYIHTNRPEDAVRVLTRAAELDANDFAVLINLATAELALGRKVDGLRHSEQCVKAAPNVSATYYMRAHAYMAFDRIAEAFTDLKKAMALDTGDPRYPLEAGDCAVALGRTDEGIELLNAGLRLQPDSVPGLVRLGSACHALGRRAEAVDAYRRAKQLQPAQAGVKELGRLLGLE
ncbi:MAG: tetratricopeptide repeat protein [Planctomycetes bacterium]|nr:tetratricopeptide repeat protein [Planctomycetota bacterium]